MLINARIPGREVVETAGNTCHGNGQGLMLRFFRLITISGSAIGQFFTGRQSSVPPPSRIGPLQIEIESEDGVRELDLPAPRSHKYFP